MFFIDAVGDFCNETKEIWRIVGWVVRAIQIGIPIILIIMGMFDLGKAALAGEEKETKAAQKMLLQRVIYGVLVFFVVTILQGILSLIGRTDVKNNTCYECVVNPSRC